MWQDRSKDSIAAQVTYFSGHKGEVGEGRIRIRFHNVVDYNTLNVYLFVCLFVVFIYLFCSFGVFFFLMLLICSNHSNES